MKWLTHLPAGGLLLALTPIVLADGDPQRLTAADAQPGQRFGSSTDISGDVIVVGAPADDDLGTDAGAVYTFERQAEIWVQVLKLAAPDGAAGHRFGHDVGLDDGLLAVAALGRVVGSVTGGVYVYSCVGSSWVYDVVFVGSPPSPVSSQERFALDVEVRGRKIAGRGSYRGEYGDLNGYSHVFSHRGVWEREARVEALGGGPPSPSSGAALALSGDWMLLPRRNGVLVFRNGGTEWVEDHISGRPGVDLQS